VRTADDAAFAAFVQARSTPLLRTAHLLTGDRHRAEDLLQTAFERLAKRWSRLDGDPEAYLRRTLVNLATDRWRLSSRRVHEVRLETDSGAPSPAMEQVESRHDLVRALGQLTSKQRAVLVLRYFEDLSEKDVAAALETSVGNVKSTTARALARLRDLAELGDTEPVPPPPPRRSR
jgi:RNA polymerase sigma-70 factor (sigma-E family)